MADVPITLFYSSVSSNLQLKKRQQKIQLVLDSKKINYNEVDICQKTEDKDKMRKIVGDPKALPPQICRGDIYCGDYDAFENAVENEQLDQFLKQ